MKTTYRPSEAPTLHRVIGAPAGVARVPLWRQRALLVFVAALFAVPAMSQAQGSAPSIYFEFANEDKGALRGVSEAAFGKDESDGNFSQSFFLAHSRAPSRSGRLSLSLEQQVFTPSNGNKKQAHAVAGDRPFAGFLAGGISYIRKDDRWLQRFALKLGVVGEDALGKDVQNGLHREVGMDSNTGWNDQVANRRGAIGEYGATLRWQTRCGSLCFELAPHATLVGGNLLQYEGIGTTLRIGNQLDRDSGPPIFSLSSRGAPHTGTRGFSWSVFAGAERRHMQRNYLLQGRTALSDVCTVSMNRYNSDRQFGMDLRWKRTAASLTFVQRTAEFPGQTPQQFLRIGLGTSY